jgi:hypothetical protein
MIKDELTVLRNFTDCRSPTSEEKMLTPRRSGGVVTRASIRQIVHAPVELSPFDDDASPAVVPPVVDASPAVVPPVVIHASAAEVSAVVPPVVDASPAVVPPVVIHASAAEVSSPYSKTELLAIEADVRDHLSKLPPGSFSSFMSTSETPPENKHSAWYKQLHLRQGLRLSNITLAVKIYVDNNRRIMPLPQYYILYILSDSAHTPLHGLLKRSILKTVRRTVFCDTAKAMCMENDLFTNSEFVQKYFVGDFKNPVVLRMPTGPNPEEVVQWRAVCAFIDSQFTEALGESAIQSQRFDFNTMCPDLNMLLHPNVLDWCVVNKDSYLKSPNYKKK